MPSRFSEFQKAYEKGWISEQELWDEALKSKFVTPEEHQEKFKVPSATKPAVQPEYQPKLPITPSKFLQAQPFRESLQPPGATPEFKKAAIKGAAEALTAPERGIRGLAVGAWRAGQLATLDELTPKTDRKSVV